MSFKTELYAVNKLYAKLIKLLPVEEMLPALTMVLCCLIRVVIICYDYLQN